MPRLVLLAALGSIALAGAGCAGPQTDFAYPVVDKGPNPAPAAGYRVVCNTVPYSTDPIVRDSTTACRQEFVRPRPVLRVRG